MGILVTGGLGDIGRPVVETLLAKGHTVRVLDAHDGPSIPGADCRMVDITDFDALNEHLGGIEGLVHLAAIPHPTQAEDHTIFRVNCEGTCNVYSAA